MKQLLNLLTALLFLLLPATSLAANNILLVIADDYGVDSSSLYNAEPNASLPPTPTIASLAASGVLFQNAYANPVCSPTRACIITGRHAFRTGIGNVIEGPTSPGLRAADFTLPEAFAAALPAYRLAQFGKWHLSQGPNGPRNIGGWQHFAGSIGGALPDYSNWTKNVNGTTTTNYTNYATTDIVDDTIAWITQQGTQPWFAWVAFNAAHTPFHKPPNALHSYDTLSGTQANINSNPRPYFEAMVEAMDTELGRLLSVVNLTNTWIIFIGDNGTATQVLQPPFPAQRGKGTLYEGGIKVPWIIAGPNIANPGRTNNTPVHVVDLFSTILELAGANPASVVPAGTTLDSQSLLPVLQDPATLNRDVYAELFGDGLSSSNAGRTLRDQQYKLIQFENGNESLYDLQSDPYETTNLLTQALSGDASAHYYSLTFKLAAYQETLAQPVITGSAWSNGQFSLTVARDPALLYTLWRTATFDSLDRVPVTNAITVTNTPDTLTLTDPTPPSTPAFYQVIATQP